MPQYRVEALEKFIVRTTYLIESRNKEAAETLCRMGLVAYSDKSIEEGNEEWLKTISVEKCTD